MNKQQKKQWLVHYIKILRHVDIFDEFFVDLYIAECKPTNIKWRAYGAQYVPELSRYLTELYKENILKRYVIGLGNYQDGFPKWCYSYELNQ